MAQARSRSVAWRQATRNGTIPAAPESRRDAGPSGAGENASVRDSETVAALPVAAVLFRALDEAGVRYGIVQDLAGLQAALAGRDDVDLLLDKRDYAAFCSIASELHGRRGVSLSCYDNVCAGREDWFVPDFSRGGFLHLDMHIGVRVGWEFRKRYLAFDHAAISRWQRIDVAGVSVPVVSPEDEIRLALARFAFRVRALPWKRWVAVRGIWTDPARLSSLSGGQGAHVAEFEFGSGRAARCRIRQDGDSLAVHRGDLARLRRSIRERCGFTTGSKIVDPVVHLARKTSYLALRFAGAPDTRQRSGEKATGGGRPRGGHRRTGRTGKEHSGRSAGAAVSLEVRLPKGICRDRRG